MSMEARVYKRGWADLDRTHDSNIKVTCPGCKKKLRATISKRPDNRRLFLVQARCDCGVEFKGTMTGQFLWG